MVKEEKIDAEAITEEKKRMGRKRLALFKVRKDGGSLWNNLKVPTMQQM